MVVDRILGFAAATAQHREALVGLCWALALTAFLMPADGCAFFVTSVLPLDRPVDN